MRRTMEQIDGTLEKKNTLDLESRLLKTLTSKNTLDSIGFLLESKQNALKLRGLVLDLS